MKCLIFPDCYNIMHILFHIARFCYTCKIYEYIVFLHNCWCVGCFFCLGFELNCYCSYEPLLIVVDWLNRKQLQSSKSGISPSPERFTNWEGKPQSSQWIDATVCSLAFCYKTCSTVYIKLCFDVLSTCAVNDKFDGVQLAHWLASYLSYRVDSDTQWPVQLDHRSSFNPSLFGVSGSPSSKRQSH